MSQMTRLLNRPQSLGHEVVAVDECLVFDQAGNDGFGVVIFPQDVAAVKLLDLPVGHFPSRTERGCEVSTATGFAAARVESCFRDQETFADGSRGPVSDWKVGTGE
jgi:hypothetical protein